MALVRNGSNEGHGYCRGLLGSCLLAGRVGDTLEQLTQPLYACAAVGATIETIAGISSAPPTPSFCSTARREIVVLPSTSDDSTRPSRLSSPSAYNTKSPLS